jgi:hypothetical protein
MTKLLSKKQKALNSFSPHRQPIVLISSAARLTFYTIYQPTRIKKEIQPGFPHYGLSELMRETPVHKRKIKLAGNELKNAMSTVDKHTTACRKGVGSVSSLPWSSQIMLIHASKH